MSFSIRLLVFASAVLLLVLSSICSAQVNDLGDSSPTLIPTIDLIIVKDDDDNQHRMTSGTHLRILSANNVNSLVIFPISNIIIYITCDLKR